MTHTSSIDLVDAQYSVTALDDAIAIALASAGRDLQALTVEDLAPVDHFHMGGLDATVRLLRRADVAPGSVVLDVGGGLGGAARVLATRAEATVTVLDATKEFCRTGAKLTELVGLRDRVTFHHGDACAMPFSEQSFDIVWAQHMTMNVADKDTLFREMYRVLRPGGRVALHEVMAGVGGPIHFPVPWAHQPSLSFLRTQTDMRQRLAAAGFEELSWDDVTEPSLQWWRQRLAAAATQPAPLGLHLLMGAQAPVKGRNIVRNLEEGRITVVQAVLRRPRRSHCLVSG